MYKYLIFLIVCLFIFAIIGADCSNNPDNQDLTITKIMVDDNSLDINNPRNVELGVSLTPDVLITFSQPVDLDQLKAKFKLTKDEPNAVTMPLTITKEDSVTIKAQLPDRQTLDRNITYTITITKNIRSVVKGVEYIFPNDITLKFSTLLMNADADLSVSYKGVDVQGSLGMFIISQEVNTDVSSVPLTFKVSSGASLYENGSSLPLSKDEITTTLDFSSNLLKSFEVVSENKKVTKRYVIQLSIDPIVSLYTGSNIVGQAIIDEQLNDFEVATITNIPNLEYTVSLGTVNKKKTLVNGRLIIMQRDLVSATAISGAKLTASLGNKIIEVATYKPNELYTWQDMQAMRKNLSGNYILKQDVTFPGLGAEGFSLQGFEPIGKDLEKNTDAYQGVLFSGTLDGNNKKIKNFAVNDEDLSYVGLFGKVSHATASTEVLKNVVFEDPNIHCQAIAGVGAGMLEKGKFVNVDVRLSKGSGSIIESIGTQKNINSDDYIPISYTAGLVGIVASESSLSECYNQVPVKAVSDFVGGLAGFNGGTVTGYATGSISGESEVGGLVGRNGGTVTGYATGSISGKSEVGGLVGLNFKGIVTGYATGSVTGIGWHVGGLVGWSHGSITGYATGDVNGDQRLGGLAGWNEEGAIIGYATGSITGGHSMGGLVGLNYDGEITGYWDIASIGQATSSGRATAVGITLIGNVAWNINTSSYEDTGNGNTTVFNHTDFINAFIVMKDNPGDGMWPKLKTNIFSFPQPDLP